MPPSPADRLEMLQAIARYNRAADERDVEAYVAEFTQDGVIEGHMTTAPGRDGLRADLPGLFAMEGTLKRHLSVNHVVSGDGDGDAATVRSMLLVVEGEGEPEVVATAQITDDMRRVDGRWLVARHHVDIDPGMFVAMKASGGG